MFSIREIDLNVCLMLYSISILVKISNVELLGRSWITNKGLKRQDDKGRNLIITDRTSDDPIKSRHIYICHLLLMFDTFCMYDVRCSQRVSEVLASCIKRQ